MTKDDRERFTLRIPSELLLKLKNKADRQGVSVNSLILKILWDWAEKNPPEMEVDI